MEMTEIKTKKPKFWVYVIFIAIPPIAGTLTTLYLTMHGADILDIILCVSLWTTALAIMRGALEDIYRNGVKRGMVDCMEVTKKVLEKYSEEECEQK